MKTTKVCEESSQLDKILRSDLNEIAIDKRLEQILYSSINGQCQEEGTYNPECIKMLGQMVREQP